MKKAIIAFAFLIIPALSLAQHDIHSVLISIDDYFKSINGIIVSIHKEHDKSMTLVDLSAKDNLSTGMVLDVFQEGQEIRHPLTGVLLGTIKQNIGTATVTAIYDNFSAVNFKGNATIAVGDVVTFETPIKIKFTLDNATNEDKSLIKSFFTNATKYEQVDDAYRFYIPVKIEENGISYSIYDNNSRLLHNSYIANKVKSEVAVTQGFTQRQSLGSIKGLYGTIAAGNLIANDNKVYIALASEKEIRIMPMEEPLKTVHTIKKDLYQVLTVETADLNGNGIDELFVTNVIGKGNVKSLVYEYSGGAFNVVQSDLPYMFRSIRMPDGTRRIFGQKLTADGEYMGEIYELFFKNGKYVTNEAMLGTIGKRIFGFSMMKSPGASGDIYVQINASNQLELSSFKKIEYFHSDYFGDTFRQLVTPVYLSKKVKNDESTDNDFSFQEKIIYIPPPIEMISDGNFIIVKNNLYARFMPNSRVFKDSDIEIYKYSHGIMKLETEAPQLEATITDIWLHGSGSNLKLLVLTTKDKTVLSSGMSTINVYSLRL